MIQKEKLILWTVDDIIGYYKNEYKKPKLLKLTDQKAQDMLIEMINNHDTSLGITWDTIESMLDQWLDN